MLNKMLRVLSCFKRPIALIFVCILAQSELKATLIIPPADMNEMISQCETIVYGEVLGHLDTYGSLNSFQIKESFKGELRVGQIIELKEYGLRTDTKMTQILGDVDYKIGSNYLLFLFQDGSGSYKAHLLSLSVFEEVVREKQKQFVHHQSVLDLFFMDHVDESIVGSYRAEDFKVGLRDHENFNLKKSGFLGRLTIEKESQADQRSSKKSTCFQPAHCTVLVGDVTQLSSSCSFSSPAKHQNGNFVVKVASGASVDPSEPNALSHLAAAVNELNNLPGITMSMASPIVQTCTITDCTSTSIQTDNVCNPNGLNEIWAYFDDPCDELPNPVNCAGMLGLGGTFASYPCHTDICGNMWLNATIPYFVMNSGAGCLSDYNYTATIIHEMMHSLNLSHIVGSCSALMNEYSCASNSPNVPHYGITQLDTDCIAWMYNQCPVTDNFNGVTYPSSYSDPEYAQNQITASNILVQSGANILYDAGTSIELNPLFEVEIGAVFHALIGGCMP